MKKKNTVPSSQYLAAPRRVPTHAEIAAEAEVLWRQKGCPHGDDEAIWLEAERQLFNVPRLARGRAETTAVTDPLSRLDPKSDEVMAELEELFPAGVNQATTAL